MRGLHRASVLLLLGAGLTGCRAERAQERRDEPALTRAAPPAVVVQPAAVAVRKPSRQRQPPKPVKNADRESEAQEGAPGDSKASPGVKAPGAEALCGEGMA